MAGGSDLLNSNSAASICRVYCCYYDHKTTGLAQFLCVHSCAMAKARKVGLPSQLSALEESMEPYGSKTTGLAQFLCPLLHNIKTFSFIVIADR